MKEPTFVLILSHWMTPAAEVGAKRFAYIGRELEERGYDVHVIAAELSASARLDDTLPAPRQVYRVPAAFRVPIGRAKGWRRAAAAIARHTVSRVADNEVGWASRAASEGWKLAAGRRNGVVIVTMPPYSSAIGALRVARRTGLPLVLDYRDPWTGYPWPDRFNRPLAKRVARSIEEAVVRGSAARVLNTPEMRDYFEAAYPWVNRDRNRVIRNGLDLSSRPRPGKHPGLDLVYAGEIYNDRSLLPVLRALEELKRADDRFEGVRLTMFGFLSEPKRREIAAAGLESLLSVREPVPRDELVDMLRSARALVAVSGEQMRYSVPFKVYEYIGVRRPILAVSPDGSALHRFIEEFGVGAHLDAAIEVGGAAQLRAVLEGDFGEELDRAGADLCWSRLADDYAELIDECTQNRG